MKATQATSMILWITVTSIGIDGVEIDLSSFYNDGNNYFNFRYLSTALGFDVDYDGATATMIVQSR